ncbi:MAG: hypothetical protein HW416_3558 [Chloroflexi bacterium]|nr:hypothetical protein [Chloroflexota bacterium]
MSRTREALSLVGLPLVLTLFFLLASDFLVGVYDEGVMLTGAFRILNGDVPSLDFYANYGPAQFYVLAGLFKVFGANVLVARIYDAAVSGAIVSFAHFYLRRTCPRWLAASCALCLAALLLEFQFHASPIPICILLSMVGTAKLSDLLAGDDGKWAYLPVSVVLGLLLLFRYDIAPLVTLALVLPIGLVHLSGDRNSGMGYRHSIRRVVGTVLVLAIAPALALLLLATTGILLPAVHDLRAYSGANYVAMRSLPFPNATQLVQSPVDSLAVYLPIAAALFATLTMGRAKREKWAFLADRQMVSIVVFTVVTGLFFTKGWVRTSGLHMLFANVPAAMLVFLCLLQRLSRDGSRRTFVVVVSLSLSLFALTLSMNWRSSPLYRELGRLEVHSELPALSYFGVEPSRLFVAQYIVRNTRPGDRIHAATGRHDKIFISDVLIYFLTQRMPATRWHHYEPGVQSTELVQLEIIRDLKANGISLLMRDLSWDEFREPNESSRGSGVHYLDQYLAETYRPILRSGPIFLYGRD